MRIIVNNSAGVLSGAVRAKLDRIFAQDTSSAIDQLKEMFPGQSVTSKHGHVQIAKEDGSLILDIFQDGSDKLRWIESKVNLSINRK